MVIAIGAHLFTDTLFEDRAQSHWALFFAILLIFSHKHRGISSVCVNMSIYFSVMTTLALLHHLGAKFFFRVKYQPPISSDVISSYGVFGYPVFFRYSSGCPSNRFHDAAQILLCSLSTTKTSALTRLSSFTQSFMLL